jgi:hypothetical protein
MPKTIEKSDLVINVNIYDSDEEESDSDFEMPETERRVRLSSIDEDTEENCNVLSILLEDIGKLEPLGKKYLFLEFHNPKNIKFHKKTEDCDFDKNELGYPLLPEGGEEFILPFFKKMEKIRPELKGTTIETNSKGFKFKI